MALPTLRIAVKESEAHINVWLREVTGDKRLLRGGLGNQLSGGGGRLGRWRTSRQGGVDPSVR